MNPYKFKMFFRNVKQLPTLAPDGKKGVYTKEQLEELLSQIPKKNKVKLK